MIRLLAALSVSLAVAAFQPAVGAVATTYEPPAIHLEHPDAQEAAGEHKDVPWVPIVILAFIVPLAALLVPSFVMGGHDSSRGKDE